MGSHGIQLQQVCWTAAAALLLIACQGAGRPPPKPPVTTVTPRLTAAPQHWQSPSTPVLPGTPPSRQELAARARREYEVAEQLLDGPERPRWWLAAARDYEAAFRDAPTIDDAPEAALNGAWAYRQVGEHAKAIEMYELFIASYGHDGNLAVLQNGDARAEPPIDANPRKYEEHIVYVAAAYEALTEVWVAVGNYQRAAEVLEAAGKNARFTETWRQDAIQKAQSLREMAARLAPSRP